MTDKQIAKAVGVYRDQRPVTPEKPGFFRKTWFLDVKENYS